MNPARNTYTVLLALVTLFFYGSFLVSWLGGYWEFYAAWDDWWGVKLVEAQGRPLLFFDLDGVLSWRDCHLRGLDVMAVNPCDPLGRPSNYSPLWYLLPTGGRVNLLPLGFLMVGSFLSLLPLMFRPATATEFVIAALAMVSPTAFYAVERANPDILMFLMTLAVLWLWRSGRSWPALGVILGAAFLKFYPLALGGLVAREPARRFWASAAMGGLLVFLFIAIFRDELARLPPLLPQPQYFGNEFGGQLFGLGVTRELDLPAITAPLLTVLLAGLCLWGGLRTAAYLGRAALKWDGREMALLLGGALVTIGCFLLMSNNGYRGIFLLMTLPGFFLLRTMGHAPARLAGRGLTLTLLCLYSEMLRNLSQWLRDLVYPQDRPGIWDDLPQVAFFLAHEAVWWWLVALLSGIVLAFLRQTPVFGSLLQGKSHA